MRNNYGKNNPLKEEYPVGLDPDYYRCRFVYRCQFCAILMAAFFVVAVDDVSPACAPLPADASPPSTLVNEVRLHFTGDNPEHIIGRKYERGINNG